MKLNYALKNCTRHVTSHVSHRVCSKATKKHAMKPQITRLYDLREGTDYVALVRREKTGSFDITSNDTCNAFASKRRGIKFSTQSVSTPRWGIGCLWNLGMQSESCGLSPVSALEQYTLNFFKFHKKVSRYFYNLFSH